MKIIFLGTNAWYDTETGNTPCILIQANDFHVVLDAGNGIYKLDRYIKDEKPIYIFLSHLHLDHVEGFHTFDRFKFKQGATIYVRKGNKKHLNVIKNIPFAKPFSKLETICKIIEINEGENNTPFNFEALDMQHTDGDLGYRFYIDNKIISYSGDTAICENSKQLANNADLLIHECTYLEQTIGDWGHVKPSEAALLAKQNNAKKLILTHFDPSKYLDIASRKEAEQIAKNIFENTIIATDGLEVLV